jgi:hypothetical protein
MYFYEIIYTACERSDVGSASEAAILIQRYIDRGESQWEVLQLI